MRPVHVETKHARAIARGHPWVYRQAIAEKPRALKNGDAVDLASDGRPFLGRGIYDAKSPVAVRVWAQRDEQRIDQPLFTQRFREAWALRDAFGVTTRSEAYRVVNAEGDRAPGVLVDRWGDWLTMTLQTPSLRPWRKKLVAALAEVVPARGIYVHDDGRCALFHGDPAPARLVVREPTCSIRVFPDSPTKPGLFTDMREIRARVAPLLGGRRFLNLFAHTGAWSAAAAAAGAAEIMSVDLSGPYLDVAAENVELSAPGYASHTLVKQDVFELLAAAEAEGLTFDAILIDPPSFSSSHKSGTFNIRDKYRPLVRAALRLLEPHGLLIAATNFRGIGRDEFVHMLQDAAEMEMHDLRVLTVHGQPEDHPVVPSFPEAAYLHVAVCSLAVQPPVRWRP